MRNRIDISLIDRTADYLDACARIMLEEVVDLGNNPATLREVRFVLFGAAAESTFRDEANRRLVAAE